MKRHLQDAKNNFSEVVPRARSEGPQTVTLRGERAAVVLPAEDYDRLSEKEYLLTGPVWHDDFAEEVNRRPDTFIRDVDLWCICSMWRGRRIAAAAPIDH